ncbi:MAG: hypothetical protein AB1505_01010 [Candidatus Latescibacterota bacterium]
MTRWVALALSLALLLQPVLALAEAPEVAGPDTRLYLTDGTVVQGDLVEETEDLFILRIEHEIHTFERADVQKKVTVTSLGGEARTIAVTEFPYISFLGGTVAFGLLSWLQFDRAADKENDADRNRRFGLEARAKKLQDDADQARLFAWGSAAVAAASLGVALIPRRGERRVFPELSMSGGEPMLQVRLVHPF